MTPATWYVVVARAGSTGCPGKAIRLLPDGSTCLGRAIQIGQHLGHVIVSTDYPRPRRPPRNVVYVARPAALAIGDAKMLDVLADVIWRANLARRDRVVLLQASSPLRTADTVSACLDAARVYGESCCTAMRYPSLWHPEYVLGTGEPMPAIRQDLPPRYRPDGGAYVSTVSQILTGSWGMMGWIVSPPAESLSIDTEADWIDACARIAGQDTPQDAQDAPLDASCGHLGTRPLKTGTQGRPVAVVPVRGQGRGRRGLLGA